MPFTCACTREHHERVSGGQQPPKRASSKPSMSCMMSGASTGGAGFWLIACALVGGNALTVVVGLTACIGLNSDSWSESGNTLPSGGRLTITGDGLRDGTVLSTALTVVVESTPSCMLSGGAFVTSTHAARARLDRRMRCSANAGSSGGGGRGTWLVGGCAGRCTTVNDSGCCLGTWLVGGCAGRCTAVNGAG